MSAAEHEKFMRRALGLARQGWGTTHPNPMVGALIVEDGEVVAEGCHAADGTDHAERAALKALGRQPHSWAVLYVTLEPCSTLGRTGACTDAIIAAGLKRVVVGATDPNPAHAGRGFEALRAAGIAVETGILEADCTDLNLIFNHWITHHTPLIAAKSAVTIDGRIACRTGESQWITGEEARADVMRWRRLFPAIAVGAGTVMNDNPRLSARVPGQEIWCPVRFVFDGLLRTVVDKSLPGVFTDAFRERTIVVTTPHGGMGYIRKLRDMGVQVWCFESPTHCVSFADFRRKCAEEKITGVLFEGGSQIVSQIIQNRQLDYHLVYRAPMLFADNKAKPVLDGLRTEKMSSAIRLDNVRHEAFGGDILTRGRVVYPEKMFIDEAAFGVG